MRKTSKNTPRIPKPAPMEIVPFDDTIPTVDMNDGEKQMSETPMTPDLSVLEKPLLPQMPLLDTGVHCVDGVRATWVRNDPKVMSQYEHMGVTLFQTTNPKLDGMILNQDMFTEVDGNYLARSLRGDTIIGLILEEKYHERLKNLGKERRDKMAAATDNLRVKTTGMTVEPKLIT